MTKTGLITLDGETIGAFEVGEGEILSFSFNKGSSGILENLEFASEQGMVLGLMLSPEFDN